MFFAVYLVVSFFLLSLVFLFVFLFLGGGLKNDGRHEPETYLSSNVSISDLLPTKIMCILLYILNADDTSCSHHSTIFILDNAFFSYLLSSISNGTTWNGGDTVFLWPVN